MEKLRPIKNKKFGNILYLEIAYKQVSEKINELVVKINNLENNNPKYGPVDIPLYKDKDIDYSSMGKLDYRSMRKNKNLTLRDVENHTGISSAYLSQLENGKIKKPSFDTVIKLLKLYGFNNIINL